VTGPAPAEWGPVLDELLAEVGWTLRATGLSVDDVASAELVPAEAAPRPGRLLREKHVALRLHSGPEVHVFRGGLMLAPSRPDEARP